MSTLPLPSIYQMCLLLWISYHWFLACTCTKHSIDFQINDYLIHHVARWINNHTSWINQEFLVDSSLLSNPKSMSFGMTSSLIRPCFLKSIALPAPMASKRCAESNKCVSRQVKLKLKCAKVALGFKTSLRKSNFEKRKNWITAIWCTLYVYWKIPLLITQFQASVGPAKTP